MGVILKKLNDELRSEIMARLRSALGALMRALLDQQQQEGELGKEQLEGRSAGQDNEVLESTIHIVAGFLSLDRRKEVIDLIRQTFTEPAIREALQECVRARQGTRAERETFSLFLQKLRRQLKSTLSPILQLASKLNTTELVLADPSAALKSSLISSTLLKPILTTIERKFASAFLVVFPELFVKNFRDAHSLIDSVLALTTEEEQKKFRSSPAWLHFEGLWNSQAYEAARFRSVLGALKPQFDSDPPAVMEKGPTAIFRLAATDCLVKSISGLLDPAQLIIKERCKVIRSVAEMFLIYYHSFLQKLEVKFSKPLALEGQSSRAILSLVLFDLVRLIPLVSNASTQSEELESEESQWIRSLKLDTKSRDLVSKIFDSVLLNLLSWKKNFECLFLKGLLARLESELLGMRGVPPVYRMTERQVTSTPSPYVSVLTSVLREFQCSAAEIAGDQVDSSSVWLPSALNQSFKLFSVRLDDVFSAVEVQDISLEKIQRRKTQQLAAGMKDSEKISRQLLIDANAFLNVWLPVLSTEAVESCDGLGQLKQSMAKLEAFINACSTIAKPAG